MKKTRIISTVLAAFLTLSIAAPISVSAGLVEVNGVKKYENKDKSYAENEFVTINKKKYYFDKNGEMVTGWLELDGKKYYFSSTGVMQTGLKKINKTYYYFSKTNGSMQTGTIKSGTNVYTFGKDGKFKSKYNGWIKFSGESYYCVKGKVTTGLKKITDKNQNTNTYYFDKNGKLVKNKTVNHKTNTLYIDKSGVVYKIVDNSANIANQLEDLYYSEAVYEADIADLKSTLEYSEGKLATVEYLLADAKKDLENAKKNTRRVYGSNGTVSYASGDTSTEQYIVNEYTKLQKDWKDTIKKCKDKIKKYENELSEIKSEIKELEAYIK